MGSVGDAWDEHIEAENPLGLLPPTQHTRNRDEIERVPTDQLKSMRWIPPVHFLIVLAGISIGLALASTGPLYPAMKYFAALAVLLGLGGTYVIRSGNNFHSGDVGGIVLAIIGALLLLIDTIPGLSPARGVLETGEARKALPADAALVTQVKTDMAYVARVARAMHVVWKGESITATGSGGMNREALPASRAFKLPTLAVLEPFFPGRFEHGLVSVERRNLPTDPFADSPNAMFEVEIYGDVGLVLSPGPDAAPDISVRTDFNPLLANPAVGLSAKTYDPTNGAMSRGDMFHVFRLDGATDADCAEIAREFEDRRWRKRSTTR